jgi:hypothetical protein
MIKTGFVLALLAVATNAFGRAGTLRTRVGKVFEGDVRLETTGSFLVVAGTNPPVRVTLAELELLNLKPEVAVVTPSVVPLGGLPAPWLSRQVGLFGQAGNAVFANGGFVVNGSGTEAFQFVYQPLAAGGELVAKLTGTTGGEAGARAGLMARTALTDDSPFVWLAAGQDGKAVVLTRALVSKNAPHSMTIEFAVPGWMKLVRIGNRVSLHSSRDGQKWEQVGGETLPANVPVFIGLAVSSGDNHALSRAVFENVALNLAPRDLAQQAITLRNGTSLAATIQTINDVTIKFTSYGRAFTFPMIDVARVLLRPVPAEKLAALPPGRRGVLLVNGDFCDGEITDLDGRKAKLSSVLFGQREYALDKEVAGLVYRDLRPPATPWLARGADGTTLQTKSVVIAGDRLVFEDEVVGAFQFPFSDLVEVKRQRSR